MITLQTRLAYQFRDPALLQLALCHRSAGKPDNERLEFLGDAVLGFIVAEVGIVQGLVPGLVASLALCVYGIALTPIWGYVSAERRPSWRRENRGEVMMSEGSLRNFAAIGTLGDLARHHALVRPDSEGLVMKYSWALKGSSPGAMATRSLEPSSSTR